MKDFVHLHLHSDHSLLDGYGTIQEYINKAVLNKQKALALTDHNTMTGIYQFIKYAKKEGLKPIAGIELNIIVKGSLEEQEHQMYGTVKVPYTHLTLIARNQEGLRNLFKLTKLSFNPKTILRGPRVDLNLLEKHSDGLICLSGCSNSDIALNLRSGNTAAAKDTAEKLKSIFGENFFIELQLSKGPNGYNLKDLVDLAQETKIRPVFTNNVHYANKEDAEIHEIWLAMGNKNKMSETPVTMGGTRAKAFDSERYLKSAEEIYNTAKQQMSFLGDNSEKAVIACMNNTIKISEMVEDYSLEYNNKLRPQAKIPSGFKDSYSYLEHLVENGFQKKRAHQSSEIQKISREKIAEEMETIKSNDFVDYFIVVQDYVQWGNKAGATGTGRGSVSGSEVAFLLDIHKTDPIRFNLLFERFISPGRGAIYKIEYEDGTFEEVNVAESKVVNGSKKYIYELKEGDIVEQEN